MAAKNAALTAAISVTETESLTGIGRIPSLEIVSIVYEGTPEGSPGRRLVTDMYGMLSLEDILRLVRKATFHEDFFIDLVKVVAKTRQCKESYVGNVVLRNGAQQYIEKPESRDD